MAPRSSYRSVGFGSFVRGVRREAFKETPAAPCTAPPTCDSIAFMKVAKLGGEEREPSEAAEGERAARAAPLAAPAMPERRHIDVPSLVHAVVGLLQREPRVPDAKNRALRVCEFANRTLRKKQRIRPLEAVRAVHKVHHRVAVLAEHGVWVPRVSRGELEALREWIAKDARLPGRYFVDGAKFPADTPPP